MADGIAHGLRLGKRGLAALALLALAGAAHADGPPLRGAFGEAVQVHTDPAPVPNVAATSPQGDAVRLTAFRGKVLVVNFWATWCAPCVEELPTLNALQKRMTDAGVRVLAVAQDVRGMKAVEPFLANRVEVPALKIAVDPDGKLARAMGVRGLPTTFVIDRDGRVVAHVRGPADWASRGARAFLRHYAGGDGT